MTQRTIPAQKATIQAAPLEAPLKISASAVAYPHPEKVNSPPTELLVLYAQTIPQCEPGYWLQGAAKDMLLHMHSDSFPAHGGSEGILVYLNKTRSVPGCNRYGSLQTFLSSLRLTSCICRVGWVRSCQGIHTQARGLGGGGCILLHYH